MNPHTDPVSQGLRELAAASPEAPPELGLRLSNAFVRHHVQRRRKRAAIVVGFAVCLVISMYWLRPANRGGLRTDQPASQTAHMPRVSPEQKDDANLGHASVEPRVVVPHTAKSSARSVAQSAKRQMNAKAEAKPRKKPVEAPAATVEAGDFVALPSFDPAIPVGDSRVVRMDLPGSALQLIGYPVEGPLLDRRILTDVLVGQDGMPYAVRLVQSRNVH